jgi:hypothetical protein
LAHDKEFDTYGDSRTLHRSVGKMPRKSYNKSVFINCPFDGQYQPLFRAMVFAVLRAGFYARSALEESDSGEIRLSKIYRIVRECRFGIHDLSRTESESGWPRFNMPFELGLFLAAKFFGIDEQDRKITLIFERKPHSYERFISDIKGQDIEAHENKPTVVVNKIRNWLATNASKRAIPGGAEIWKDYQRFLKWLPAACKNARLVQKDLTFTDYWQLVDQWIEQEL